MAGPKHFFLVVFFNKNRRLLLALGALLAIAAAVWLLVAFTNFLISANQEPAIPYTVVSQDLHWQGFPAADHLPRFFVAGGPSYDAEILVDGWGLDQQSLVPVDYMEELGIHILHGQVLRITYTEQRLNVYVEERQGGYQLVAISKSLLDEGELQVVFLDARGVPLAYEEEYIYSVPLAHTIVKSGDAGAKAAVFMEILDQETLPAFSHLEGGLLAMWPDSLLIYVHGGQVATVQRQGNIIRIYAEREGVWQVLALDNRLFREGQNVLRLIDCQDLSVNGEIVFWIAKK